MELQRNNLLDSLSLRSVNELTTNEKACREVGLPLEDGGVEVVGKGARHSGSVG